MVHALKPSIDRVDRYRSIDRSVRFSRCGGSGRVGSMRTGTIPASAIVRHTRASGMEPGTLALVAVLAMAGVKVTIGGYLLAMGYVKCGGDANGGRTCLGFGRKDGDVGEEARARLTEEGAESASGKPKEA